MSRAREDKSRTSPPAKEGEQPSTAAAALVVGYIEQRAREGQDDGGTSRIVEDLLRRVADLEGEKKKTQALTSTIVDLRTYIEQLEETIRQLQIGIRRHPSERVSPDQLALALTKPTEQGPESSPSAVPDTATTPTPAPAAPPAGAPPSDAEEKKKHTPHGRRPIGVLPQIIVEIQPPEVLLHGLAAYERIGAEDASVIGYRRGGPIEVVLRRVKYVEKAVTTTIDGEVKESTPPVSHDVPLVREHEVARVPEDTTFKHNPFVDGVLVRYTPPTTPTPEAEAKGPRVLIAPVPERPIYRGLADPSLLAHLFTQKLDLHLPYYRQEVQLKRYGWPISRATMSSWQSECGELVKPIVDAMWDQALKRSWFGMDATGTAVRAEKENRLGHVYVLVAPGDAILFRYTPKNDGATVAELFGGFQGTIVADAASVNNVLFGPGKARQGGCWAHGRRPFFQAFLHGKDPIAAEALRIIQGLFRIEKKAALASPDQRLAVRQQESAPLVDQFFALVDVHCGPDGKPNVKNELLRKALVYAVNQREILHEFLLNGEIPLSNNASERALRKVVKGRANWLFHGSDDHAVRACALTSLIASCELLGIDPELYLQEILTVAPSYPARAVLDLAPANWIKTRQRLIAEGRLKYIDLAGLTGARLKFRQDSA